MLPEISVIIPIYNVERYLSRCLDSVINQKNVNKEIILVNDGSTDNSLEIMQYYKRKYDEIIIVNKKNGGLSDARNLGIKYASAKYISFIDSDDFVDDTMLIDMLNIAYKENSDIVISDFYIYNELNEKYDIYKSNTNYRMDKNEVIKEFLLGHVKAYAWNKIYRRDLFTENNICYPIGKSYEDIPTTIQLFNKAVKINYLNKPLYYYVQRCDSITRTHKLNQVTDILSNLEVVSKISNEKFNKEFQIFHLQNILMAASIYYECIFGGRYSKKQLDAIKYILKKEKEKIKISLMDSGIEMRVKFKYILFKFNLYEIAILFKERRKFNIKLANN